MKLPRIKVVAITTLLLCSVAVGTAGPAIAATDATDRTTASQSQSVRTCGLITDPGVYELEANLTDPVNSPNACIEVAADDVALHGNGHSITMTGNSSELGSQSAYAVRAEDASNVTVTNLSADDWSFRADAGDVDDARFAGLLFENVTDATASDISATNSWDGVVVRDSEEVRVREVRLLGDGVSLSNGTVSPLYQQSGSGVHLANVENVSVSDGHLRRWNVGVTVAESAGVHLTNLSVGETDGGDYPQTRTGIDVVATENATIHDSAIGGTKSAGIKLARSTGGVVVADNRLAHHERAAIHVSVFGTPSGENVVRDNEVTENGHGIRVWSTTTGLRVEENRLIDNRVGVGVEEPSVCADGPEGGELVVVRENVVASNTVGIRNEDTDAVDATG